MARLLKFVLSAAIIATLSLVSQSQNKDPLEEANQLHENRQFAQAVEAYQKLLADTADIPTRAKIKFNLGITYRMLKQYDRSIESFKEVLAMDVNDNEPGGHIMELRRNYRPRAQSEIGNSLFAKGDHGGALAAFRTSWEKYKINTGCGTCNKSVRRRNNITEGIVLEALGRYSEAVIPYLKADEGHLAELYFSAGQLEDLREIIEKNIAALMQKHSWRRDYAIEHSPYRNLIASINAYDMEKTGNWQELIKMAYRSDRDFGRNNIPVTLLARHADKISGLLLKQISTHTLVSQNGVINEILALSGTDGSLALLKELISKHGVGGPEGYFILIQTYRRSDERVKSSLREMKTFTEPGPYYNFYFERGDVDQFGRFEIKFPRISKLPRLPRADEVDLDALTLKSRPE